MIPFPKLHIAESVLNRIFNALDGEMTSINPPMEAPDVPDASAEGAAVETQLATPPAPAEVAPGTEQAAGAGALESTLSGGGAFDGALMGSLQG
jgi:hypothetical protein